MSNQTNLLENIKLKIFVFGLRPSLPVIITTNMPTQLLSVVAKSEEEAMRMIKPSLSGLNVAINLVTEIELSKVFQSDSFKEATGELKQVSVAADKPNNVVKVIEKAMKVRMPKEHVIYNLKYARDELVPKKYKNRLTRLINEIQKDAEIVGEPVKPSS